MAFVFQPDSTLVGFNAYATVQQVKDYQDSKLNTTFLALADAVIERLIVFSTRQIDTLVWKGIKTDIDQPLEFPRNYLWKDGNQYNSDAAILNASMFDPNSIPQFLIEMCADICGTLANEDTTAPTGLENFSRLKVDTIEIETKKFSPTAWLPDSSRNLAWRYLANASKYSVNAQRVG